MSRKILILAGSYFQIPVIESAKRLGCTVVTCDNRPVNPGHRLADVYVNVSTTDIEGIGNAAREYKVDGILAYASDPAAIPAAVVAERLGLPGNSAASVRRLGLKSEFRRLQREMQLPHPRFVVLQRSNKQEAADAEIPFDFPVMAKPTDSSGSKGVSRVNGKSELAGAIELAGAYSRNGKIIVEECIDSDHAQIVGEAFVLGGNVAMLDIADHELSVGGSGLVPVGGTFPSGLWELYFDDIKEQLHRILRGCGFKTGALNLEVRIGKDGRPYFMDIGPRSGGNYLPELMKYTVGADVATASVKAALGDPDVSSCFQPEKTRDSVYCYYVHHVSEAGLFSAIEWERGFRAKHVVSEFVFKQEGESVSRFSNSSDLLGIAFLRFGDRASARDFFANPGAVLKYDILANARNLTAHNTAEKGKS